MKKERIFWGVFFILAAVFLIVGRIGLFGGINVWTLIVTVFLAACLIKSILYKSVSGVLFSVAFLCIIYDQLLGIENLTPWPVLGAALLGSIGAGFLYHPHRKYDLVPWHLGGTQETTSGAQVVLNTTFGEGLKYVNSENFESADLRCAFGELKVFFDNAIIMNQEEVIQVDVSFGNAELYIPRTWIVDNQIRTSFAGVNEKGRNQSTGVPQIKLTGRVSFGNVDIIYI